MKRVFSSHSEVAHIWAQQKQSEGRAGNIFFEGTEIFSYGHHYKAAKFFTRKDKKFVVKFVVLNSRKYSNTTCKHMWEIRDAVSHLPSFESPDVSDLNCTMNYQAALVDFAIEAALKKSKITTEDDKIYWMTRIEDAQDNLDVFRRIMGKKPAKRNAKKLKEVKEHLHARYKRYLELNTPEALAKKQAAYKRKNAENITKENQILAERIAEFRAGKYVTFRFKYIDGPEFDLLRIQGDEIVTHRGARVPLSLAIDLYHAIASENAARVIGQSIGDFTVTAITPLDNGDKAIKIGCHNILYSEAKQVIEAFKSNDNDMPF